jgi:hypothetical protein
MKIPRNKEVSQQQKVALQLVPTSFLAYWDNELARWQ